METKPTNPPTAVPAPAPGVFRWQKLPAWFVGCAGLGLLIAWAAVVARGYAAPLVLFPLAAGAILGGVLVLAMRVLDIGHRPTAWLGALCAASLMVAGEHYLTFWKEQQRLTEDPKRLMMLRVAAPESVPPADFREFMTWSAAQGLPIGSYTAQGGLAWFIWSLDGLLVLVPAMVLVGATARLPYCNRCRQWYHTTRSGRLDSRTATAIHTLLEIGREAETTRDRYRLLSCQGGCGPTGIVLSGEGADGRPLARTVWIESVRARHVVQILDELTQRQTDEDAPKTIHEGEISDPHEHDTP